MAVATPTDSINSNRDQVRGHILKTQGYGILVLPLSNRGGGNILYTHLNDYNKTTVSLSNSGIV